MEISAMEKVERMLASTSISTSTRSMLVDMQKGAAAFGGKMTPKQEALVSSLFENTVGDESGPKRHILGDMKPFTEANCKDCLDSGFIRLKRKETFEDWAKWEAGSAPCHCSQGKRLIEAARRTRNTDLGPQFNDAWRKSYDIVENYLPTYTRDA